MYGDVQTRKISTDFLNNSSRSTYFPASRDRIGARPPLHGGAVVVGHFAQLGLSAWTPGDQTWGQRALATASRVA